MFSSKRRILLHLVGLKFVYVKMLSVTTVWCLWIKIGWLPFYLLKLLTKYEADWSEALKRETFDIYCTCPMLSLHLVYYIQLYNIRWRSYGLNKLLLQNAIAWAGDGIKIFNFLPVLHVYNMNILWIYVLTMSYIRICTYPRWYKNIIWSW